MTNLELSNIFLNHYGLRQTKGPKATEGEIAPILPFILQAISFHILNKKMRDIPMKQELKKKYNRYVKDQSDFMRYFLCAYSRMEGGEDEAIGKIAELAQFLSHDIFILEIGATYCFRNTSYDIQQIFASFVSAGELSEKAEISWNELYPYRSHVVAMRGTQAHIRYVNPQTGTRLSNMKGSLQKVRKSQAELGAELLKFYNVDDNVSDKRIIENLLDAAEVIYNKIIRWLKNERAYELQSAN